MRFSLNDCSPFLSHFVCLLLGLCLSNFVASQHIKEEQYPNFQVVYPVAKGYLSASSLASLHLGQKVYLVKDHEEHAPLCLFKIKPLILLQVQPFLVLGIAVSEMNQVVAIMKPRFRKKLSLVSTEKIQHYKVCDIKPRISYGVHGH